MQTREGIPAFGAFALISALGFDEGGYAATAWGWSGVVVLALLTWLLARGAPRPTTAGFVLVAALAGFAAWTAASVLWSSHVAASVLEVERLLLYVGAAGAFALAGSGPALLAGVLAASSLLCGFGLTRWLLAEPEVPLSADPEAANRLTEPIGYANGVAVLAAMGLLVALGFVARAARREVAAVTAAAVPLLVATLYFTFSRGGWLALFIGLAVVVVVGPARLQLAATAIALAPLGAAALIAARTLDGGKLLAMLIVLSAVAATIAFTFPSRLPTVPRQARTAFAVALVLAPVILVTLTLVRLGGPRGAYESFKAAPAPVHGGDGRILSASGSSRADYWDVALRSFEAEPLLGAGGGTFARTWLLDRPIAQPVRDAHSLYLETLAELGPIGLMLLLAALAAPLTGRRSPWTPAALGPYAVFLAHAAQDWDWEVPAATIAALACGAAMVVPPTRRRLPRAVAIVPLVLCALAIVAYAGNRVLAGARAAADRSDFPSSAKRARTATRLQPWSSEPWRLRGEAELAIGADAAARQSFRRGLDLDPHDWELWLDLGLASEGLAQQTAWARAASLNPLSPELTELGFKSR